MKDKPGARKSSDGDALRCGSISLNKKTMLVTVKGRETAINAREYFLLVYLLENKESVLTRQSILEHVWGDDLDVNDRVVDNTIRRLRESLGDASSQIKTVIGRGYRLTEESPYLCIDLLRCYLCGSASYQEVQESQRREKEDRECGKSQRRKAQDPARKGCDPLCRRPGLYGIRPLPRIGMCCFHSHGAFLLRKDVHDD